MASMMLDLPAPVGPVSTKRSASPKSMTVRSRKDAKPLISSRVGRKGFLQQFVEQGDDALVGGVALFEVAGEQLDWRGIVLLSDRGRLVVALGLDDAHVHGVGQALADGFGEAGAGGFVEEDPEVGIAGAGGLLDDLVEAAAERLQGAAAGQRDFPHL